MYSDYRDTADALYETRYGSRPRADSAISACVENDARLDQINKENDNLKTTDWVKPHTGHGATGGMMSRGFGLDGPASVGRSSSRQQLPNHLDNTNPSYNYNNNHGRGDYSTGISERNHPHNQNNLNAGQQNHNRHKPPFGKDAGQTPRPLGPGQKYPALSANKLARGSEEHGLGGGPVPFYSSSASSLSAPSLVVDNHRNHTHSHKHHDQQTRSRAGTNVTQAGSSTQSIPPVTPTFRPTPIPNVNTFVDELAPHMVGASSPSSSKAHAGVVLMDADANGKEVAREYMYPTPWASDNLSESAAWKKWFKTRTNKWFKGFKKDELDFAKRYDIWEAKLKKRKEERLAQKM